MKPSSFEYHAPETVEEAVELLTQFGDNAKILAGGQSLVPMLALRLTAFEHLVDLRRIDGLDGIDRRDGTVRVGRSGVVGHSVDSAHRSLPDPEQRDVVRIDSAC